MTGTRFARAAAISAAVLALAACSPLQQSALMYSSKHAIGIDIATATTETPGGSLTIGMKLLDAAYVPVAVSKQKDSGAPGTEGSIGITRIEAQYGEGDPNATLEQLSDQDKDRIANFLKAKASEEKAADTLKRLTVDLASDQTRRTRALAVVAEREAKLAPKADVDSAKERVAKIDQDIAKTQLEIAAARQRLTDARIATEAEADGAGTFALLRTAKRDALSVYGRFNSEGSGSPSASASAKLTAGKIFSTGVASQNLTEAVKAEARSGAVAACLESLTKLLGALKEAERKDHLERLLPMCSK